MESSWTSLASRTHFEVLGLGLEACNSTKMPCPLHVKSTIFYLLKMGKGHDHFCFSSWSTPETSQKIYEDIFLRTPELLRKICDFLRARSSFFSLMNTCALCPWSLALASSIPVLGLERVCPRKSVLGLGLGFFCVLGL